MQGKATFLWLAVIVVLAGAYAFWSHGHRVKTTGADPQSASRARDVSPAFAASFKQPPATSKPLPVTVDDLPPVDPTARPIDVR